MAHSPVLSRAGERLTASGSSSSGIRPRGIFAPLLSTSPSPDSTNNRRHLHHHRSVTHQKRSRSVRTERGATITRSSASSTPTQHPRHSSPPPAIDPAKGLTCLSSSHRPQRNPCDSAGTFSPAHHHRPVLNSERPNSSHPHHTAKPERSSTSCTSSFGTRKATLTHPLSRPLHL